MSDHFTRLGDKVHELMEITKVPGLAIGVLHQGQITAAGFGVTNVDHPLPVTAETLFQVGSISKTFTATLALRLVEMGKLDLNLPVRHYLPDFNAQDEEVAAKVTPRHLFTHMTGWEGDLFIDTGAGEDALARYVARLAEQEQVAPFDTVWSYNNAGFSVAAYIMEKVTGRSFESLLQELVLEPLGLNHTYLNPTDIMTHRFVAGHEVKDEKAQVVRPWPLPRATWPVGGVISTVPELLRYAEFHLGQGQARNGERVLSPESLAFMQTQQVTIGGSHEAMALTWFINHTGGVRHLSHTGSTLGQVAQFNFVPQHQFALAILTNADRGRRANRELTRFILKEYLGLETVDPEPLELSEAELRPYVGRYIRPFSEAALELEGGRLMLYQTPKGSFPTEAVPVPPPPPPIPLAPYQEDYLIVLEGDSKTVQAEIIRRPDGSIGWLRWGSRLHRRVD